MRSSAVCIKTITNERSRINKHRCIEYYLYLKKKNNQALRPYSTKEQRDLQVHPIKRKQDQQIAVSSKMGRKYTCYKLGIVLIELHSLSDLISTEI